ncbi:MAG: DUF1134 domain-containing protein [Hyphomicrobium sp.]|nr:DUF1134 domain-containing protein [Hyphomicrobium sp.]
MRAILTVLAAGLLAACSNQAARPTSAASAPAPNRANPATNPDGTYKQQDVLSAAEDVFGRGAKGLADIIERSFKERGEPSAYIVGREGGGAFVVGLRYGSGTMFHKVEGQQPVFWTGPSVGFDVGADASRTFILVYNLNDTNDLYKRYPAGEGKAFFVGGFGATYLQRDDIVLVPIKLGVGVRLGVNAGYLNFTRELKRVPL